MPTSWLSFRLQRFKITGVWPTTLIFLRERPLKISSLPPPSKKKTKAEIDFETLRPWLRIKCLVGILLHNLCAYRILTLHFDVVCCCRCFTGFIFSPRLNRDQQGDLYGSRVPTGSSVTGSFDPRGYQQTWPTYMSQYALVSEQCQNIFSQQNP